MPDTATIETTSTHVISRTIDDKGVHVCLSPIDLRTGGIIKFTLFDDGSLGVEICNEFGQKTADLGDLHTLTKALELLETGNI